MTILKWVFTDVAVDVWSTTLEGILRHEQALETSDMSVWFCGLSVHDAMMSEAGVTNCRLLARPGVVVTVVVAVGIVITSVSSPMMTVVVVVMVLGFQSTNWHQI